MVVKTCLLALVTVLYCSDNVLGEMPRVFPVGEFPADVRLGPLKDLDGYFPFTPPASREAWKARSERVRRQILVSQGLWPMPAKTALNTVIHDASSRRTTPWRRFISIDARILRDGDASTDRKGPRNEFQEFCAAWSLPEGVLASQEKRRSTKRWRVAASGSAPEAEASFNRSVLLSPEWAV